MDYILIAILIVLPEEVDRKEEAPQHRVIKASVHFGLATAENNLLCLGVQWGIIFSIGFESVGIRRMCS